MSRPPQSAGSPPLWLLDIDGVVNALRYGPGAGIWAPQEWIRREVITPIEGRGMMRLPILAARPVLDFVTRVHQSGAAQVHWHSTWRSAAVTAFAPTFGLPTSIPISTAPEWEDRPGGVWWKLPAAQRAASAGRRLVWTDDDLPVFADQAADLDANPDALLLGPDPELGLSPDDLARISEFIGL